MKCLMCQREATPTKKFSWFWFILWLILTGPFAILYLIHYWTKQADICPYCKNKMF